MGKPSVSVGPISHLLTPTANVNALAVREAPRVKDDWYALKKILNVSRVSSEIAKFPLLPPRSRQKARQKKKRKKKSVPIGEMKKSQTYIKYEGSYENQNKHLWRVEKK